jgi:hemerythrin-like metal-binding protein
MSPATKLMRWLESYSTGVPGIDREHEELTGRLNALYEVFRADGPRPLVLSRFDEFIGAVRAHFDHEHDLMREAGYPDADLHAAEHGFLLDQVTQYRAQFAAGTVGMTESMLEFLRDWLRDHILISDRRLGRFLCGRPR